MTKINYNFILIITNRLIKYIYIILYLENSTTEDLIYIFFRIIIVNYKILEKIISDKNKFFILKF